MRNCCTVVNADTAGGKIGDVNSETRESFPMNFQTLCESWFMGVEVDIPNLVTRNSAIAEGPREALVRRNPATTKHLI